MSHRRDGRDDADARPVTPLLLFLKKEKRIEQSASQWSRPSARGSAGWLTTVIHTLVENASRCQEDEERSRKRGLLSTKSIEHSY